MRRVSNVTIWAGVAAIVCGVVIASFLGGTGTPWIPVLLTVALGLVTTSVRTRREARRLHERYPTDGPEARETIGAAPTSERPRVAPGGRLTSVAASDAISLRRAGARSQSLGAKPPAPREEDQPQ